MTIIVDGMLGPLLLTRGLGLVITTVDPTIPTRLVAIPLLLASEPQLWTSPLLLANEPNPNLTWLERE